MTTVQLDARYIPGEISEFKQFMWRVGQAKEVLTKKLEKDIEEILYKNWQQMIDALAVYGGFGTVPPTLTKEQKDSVSTPSLMGYFISSNYLQFVAFGHDWKPTDYSNQIHALLVTREPIIKFFNSAENIKKFNLLFEFNKLQMLESNQNATSVSVDLDTWYSVIQWSISHD